MPSSTGNYGLPYPVSTDPANISSDIENLAVEVDDRLLNLQSSFSSNTRYTTSSLTASNNDIIICDTTSPITITLPTSPQEDNVVRIYNNNTGIVTVAASTTINGNTTISSQSGVIATFTGGDWWCLPLSSSQPEAGWTRPSDWINIPTLVNGESVVYGVVKIFDYLSNEVSITASGAYTVDWGDGSAVESFSSLAVATHTYDATSISESTRTSDDFKQCLIELRPQTGQILSRVGVGYGVIGPSMHLAELVVTSPDLYDFLGDCSTVESFIVEGNNLIINPSTLYLFLAKNIYVDGPILEIFPSLADCPVIKKLYINSTTLQEISSLFQWTNTPVTYITSTASINNFASVFSSSDVTYEQLLDINLNTSSGTNFSGMFNYTKNLRKVPNYNLNNATSVSSMFNRSCIEEIPSFNLSSVISAGSFCDNASNLRASNVTGLKVTHGYSGCNLSASALNNIYTNLGTANSGAIITVTGNPGVTGDNPQIAIDKGWTVTG